MREISLSLPGMRDIMRPKKKSGSEQILHSRKDTAWDPLLSFDDDAVLQRHRVDKWKLQGTKGMLLRCIMA